MATNSDNPSALDSPPDWGQDQFTAFLDGARRNAFASFHSLKGSYRRISDIDQIFLDLFEDLKDPSNPAVAALGIRAHAAWRGAAALAMSGQITECYPLLRASLENALYANRFDHVPSSFDVWTKRGQSEDAKKACRNEFGGKNLFDPLRERDASIATAAGELYERTIDFGAHPNELALLGTMSMDETEEHWGFSFAYLSGDGPELRLALRTVAQVGIVVLDILGLSLSAEYASRALAVPLAAVRVGL